ncbi:hypothetical protein ZWY2020_007198 [Hordeum vulgare]|nr:hypothetical protein ZWY2020_007198 [Hordeum vulgare]
MLSIIVYHLAFSCHAHLYATMPVMDGFGRWHRYFVDAFLFRIKKNRESLMSRKIWSRRYSISQEFVDCSVLNYNGKTHVRCKITEGKVGHKFGEFAFTRANLGHAHVRPYNTRDLGLEQVFSSSQF